MKWARWEWGGDGCAVQGAHVSSPICTKTKLSQVGHTLLARDLHIATKCSCFDQIMLTPLLVSSELKISLLIRANQKSTADTSQVNPNNFASWSLAHSAVSTASFSAWQNSRTRSKHSSHLKRFSHPMRPGIAKVLLVHKILWSVRSWMQSVKQQVKRGHWLLEIVFFIMWVYPHHPSCYRL